ncbi:hypothetical protein KDL45_06290 [bacterium]|nr:hypothetical protein [bacterium]
MATATASYKDLVNSRHPAYVAREAFWRLARSSYQGGPDFAASSHLFGHRLENRDDYQRRAGRAYYLNYCRPVVDTYASYLFRTPPSVLPSESLGSLVGDADGRGGDLTSLMKRAFVQAAIFGHVLIGVDRPRSDKAPTTKAEEIELGLNDYFHLVLPDNFLHWATDGDGAMQWCLVRHPEWRAAPGKPQPAKGDALFGYRLWTRDEWISLDESGAVLERGANPYGRVPFVSLRFRESDRPVVGESLLASIAYVNREIFNLSSLLSEILYRQTFSQLVAEGSSHEYAEGGDLGKLGTASIFLYPEGRTAPQFISPDAAQAQLLMEQIDHLIDEVYRLANLSRGSAREGKMASGIAKAFDFLDTNQALADAAQNVASAFSEAIGLARPEWRGTIQFPGDFGVADAGTMLDEIERTHALPIGPTFRRRLLEKLARSLLRELPEAQRREVFHEIQQGPDAGAGSENDAQP